MTETPQGRTVKKLGEVLERIEGGIISRVRLETFKSEVAKQEFVRQCKAKGYSVRVEGFEIEVVSKAGAVIGVVAFGHWNLVVDKDRWRRAVSGKRCVCRACATRQAKSLDGKCVWCKGELRDIVDAGNVCDDQGGRAGGLAGTGCDPDPQRGDDGSHVRSLVGGSEKGAVAPNERRVVPCED